MPRFKIGIVLLFIACAAAAIIAGHSLVEISPQQVKFWLLHAGAWAPILYIFLYVIATVLVFPSTPLNMLGGAIFGLWFGLVWTSFAAIVAAIVSFVFARTLGREAVAKRLAGRWQAMDVGMRQGGVSYMFAIRMVPMMPYGLVNFAAGLTSVRFRDYVVGTALGTVPTIFPYVLLGCYGLKAIKTGELLPVAGALALVGLLVAGSTWYRRHSAFTKERKGGLSVPFFKRFQSRDF